jgi:cell division septation protein DedD
MGAGVSQYYKGLILLCLLTLVLNVTGRSHASVREFELFDEGYEYYLSYKPEKAAEIFRRFLHEFPESSAKDAVLFWLGKSLEQMNTPDEARVVFTELQHQFPDSPFIPYISKEYAAGIVPPAASERATGAFTQKEVSKSPEYRAAEAVGSEIAEQIAKEDEKEEAAYAESGTITSTEMPDRPSSEIADGSQVTEVRADVRETASMYTGDDQELREDPPVDVDLKKAGVEEKTLIVGPEEDTLADQKATVGSVTDASEADEEPEERALSGYGYGMGKSAEHRDIPSIPDLRKRDTPSMELGTKKVQLYAVQVGVFKDRINALKLKHVLEPKGYRVLMREETSGKDILFRVCVGEFLSRNEAESTARMLKDREGLDTLVKHYKKTGQEIELMQDEEKIKRAEPTPAQWEPVDEPEDESTLYSAKVPEPAEELVQLQGLPDPGLSIEEVLPEPETSPESGDQQETVRQPVKKEEVRQYAEEMQSVKNEMTKKENDAQLPVTQDEKESEYITRTGNVLNRIGVHETLWRNDDVLKSYMNEKILLEETRRLEVSPDMKLYGDLIGKHLLNKEDADFLYDFLSVNTLLQSRFTEMPEERLIERLTVQFSDITTEEKINLATELQVLAKQGTPFQDISSSYPQKVQYGMSLARYAEEKIQDKMKGLADDTVMVMWSADGYEIIRLFHVGNSFSPFEKLNPAERDYLSNIVREWIADLISRPTTSGNSRTM